MKKVWYLENKNKNKTKVVKLFLYDKDGIVEAWLDLSSFAQKRSMPDWELVFFSSDGKEAARLSPTSGKTENNFWQDAVGGKGRIGEDTAKKLRCHQKALGLCIKAAGEIWASDSGLFAALDEGRLKQDGSVSDVFDRVGHEEKDDIRVKVNMDESDPDEANQDKADPGIANQDEANLDEANPDEADLDEADPDEADPNESLQMENATDNSLRRVVELSVLEDEMLFRAYVHNSFLLHGYYNYGHLVLDEKNGRSRLGVPGNYYEREEVVAGMFGFPDFEPAKGREKQTGVFGYYFTKG